MLALRTRSRAFGIAEGGRIARDIYGLAVSGSELSGERDANFHLRTADAREFVLKILDLRDDADGTDCLAQALGFLAEQDSTLPVPRLFPTLAGMQTGRFSRDGIDYATCLVSYLPGRLLADSAPGAALLENLGRTLARIDRALRGFFHPALGHRLAWDVRRLPELVEFTRFIESAALRQSVERASSGLRDCLPKLRGLRSQAVHGDCHAANLLVDPQAREISGILDFGDMIHAPRIFEPAVAISELLTENVAPLDAAADVLRGYAHEQRLETAEVDLLYDIVCARHAVTLLVHGWRGQHDAAGARVLDDAAANAGRSLEHLQRLGREALTRAWHDAAGTEPKRASQGTDTAAATLLARRHRLMGAGAELFYDTPLHLVRGAGVWLYDEAGRAYLDVYNNVPHVGHGHPTVVGAIQRQSALLATHTRYLHEAILEYAERLTRRLPAHLDTCIFVNSGSEANDVAWRIARFVTGNQGALVIDHAYHGITDAVAALTPGARQPHDPRVAALAPPPAHLRAVDAMGALHVAAASEDTERAIRVLRERGVAPAAFFIDTAITSSGIFDPPPAWVAAVAAKVRAAGGVCVADEVQFGLGRSGSHFWGFERRGLEPDLVTLGKPVANGYPMGVVVANRALIEAFQAKFGFFSTFGGNAVAAAAGLAVLKVLDREALMANAEATGGYLRSQLEAIAARRGCLGAVRGAGLLLGLEILGQDASAAKRRTRRIVNALAADFRILIGSEGPNSSILKLRPPMLFGREHADLLVHAIDSAAAAVDAGGN